MRAKQKQASRFVSLLFLFSISLAGLLSVLRHAGLVWPGWVDWLVVVAGLGPCFCLSCRLSFCLSNIVHIPPSFFPFSDFFSFDSWDYGRWGDRAASCLVAMCLPDRLSGPSFYVSSRPIPTTAAAPTNPSWSGQAGCGGFRADSWAEVQSIGQTDRVLLVL